MAVTTMLAALRLALLKAFLSCLRDLELIAISAAAPCHRHVSCLRLLLPPLPCAAAASPCSFLLVSAP